VNSGFAGQGLLIQLRSHYPTGCLLSELLQVVENIYVVRATVEVDGTAIASAMSAAASIAVAEDQARMRLMSVMGLTPLGLTETKSEPTAMRRIPDIVSPPQVTEIGTELPAPLEVPVSLTVDAPTTVAATTVLTDSTSTTSASTASKATAKSTKSKAKSAKAGSAPKPEVPPPPEPMVEMTGGVDEVGDLEIEYEFTMDGEVLESSSTPVTDDEAMPVEPPIDLSDAIVQIGAEIERIGWTKKQGSAYLQETYGKRTRAELTEEELLSFLHYLKALPSKVQPAFNDLPF
jgi:hypothetical protein